MKITVNTQFRASASKKIFKISLKITVNTQFHSAASGKKEFNTPLILYSTPHTRVKEIHPFFPMQWTETSNNALHHNFSQKILNPFDMTFNIICITTYFSKLSLRFFYFGFWKRLLKCPSQTIFFFLLF